MNYDTLPTHRLMVRDEARTDAFRRAIEATIKPGDVVVDVGAGSGILSLFAAKAGAARVYAVERGAAAQAAAQLVAANGFASVIQIVQADIRSIQLAEKADVIVSEWMGSVGVDENMLGPVLWARDHFLKQGGTVIPAKVTAWMAPVRTTQRSDTLYFFNRPYGLDLSALAEPSVHELLMVRRRVRPEDLAAPAQVLWISDAAADSAETVRKPYTASLRFQAGRGARVNALAAWFTADLAGAVTLSTAPDAPDTHWGQFLLPLPEDIAVKSGDTLHVEVSARSVGPGPLQWSWTVRLNDGPPRRQDTMADPAEAMQMVMPERQRSELSSFLAELARDPTLLAAFLADPDAVMAERKVPEPYREALKTGDPGKIQEALFKPVVTP